VQKGEKQNSTNSIVLCKHNKMSLVNCLFHTKIEDDHQEGPSTQNTDPSGNENQSQEGGESDPPSDDNSDGDGDDNDDNGGDGKGGWMSKKAMKAMIVSAVQTALRNQRSPARRRRNNTNTGKRRDALEEEKAADKPWQRNIYLVG